MEITRATEYAVRCVLHLALEPGTGSSRAGRSPPRGRSPSSSSARSPSDWRGPGSSASSRARAAATARDRRRPAHAARRRGGSGGGPRAQHVRHARQGLLPHLRLRGAPRLGRGSAPAARHARRRHVRRTRGAGGPLPMPAAMSTAKKSASTRRSGRRGARATGDMTIPPQSHGRRRGGAEGRSPSAERSEHDGGPQRQDPGATTVTGAKWLRSRNVITATRRR